MINLSIILYIYINLISDDLNGISFGIDDEGNYGYIKAGADTVTPFKTGDSITEYIHKYVSYGNNDSTYRAIITNINYFIKGFMFTYMSCQHCRLNNFKVVGKDSLNVKYDVSTRSSLDIWSYTASGTYGSGIIEYNLYFK